MRVPKQRYFHLPDERDGAQYLESAAQPVVSGDRVRAVRRAKLLASVENQPGQIDDLTCLTDHLGRGVTYTTKNALSSYKHQPLIWSGRN
jgi:hypothetical protein